MTRFAAAFTVLAVSIAGAVCADEKDTKELEGTYKIASAEIDGKLIVRHTTDHSDLDIPREGSLDDDMLGLGTTFDAVACHTAELVVPASPATKTTEVP